MEDCMNDVLTVTNSCSGTELTDLSGLIDDYSSSFCSGDNLLDAIADCDFSKKLSPQKNTLFYVELWRHLVDEGEFSSDNMAALNTEVTCVNILTFEPDCYDDCAVIVEPVTDYRDTVGLVNA